MSEMITLTESEYNTMEDEANKMAGSITRLTKERDELRKALTDALGPVAAWAGTYAGQREMPNIHPQHQELIDRIKALATPDVPQEES